MPSSGQRRLITRYQNNEIGLLPEKHVDLDLYHQALDDCHFDHALPVVWGQVRGLINISMKKNPGWPRG